MGGIFGKSTPDSYAVLESLDKSIQEMQQSKNRLQTSQRRVPIYLMCVSACLLLLGGILTYFYFENTMQDNSMIYAAIGSIISSVSSFLLKKCLSAIYVQKIEELDKIIDGLKHEKARELNRVMETQTYNEARNLIQQFAPELHGVPVPDPV